MKYMNFKRYKFSTIYKSVNTLGNNLLKTFKILDFRRYNFSRYNLSKIYRYIDITRLKHIKIAKFFNLSRYNIKELTKINFTRNKVLFFHIPVAIFIFGFFYIAIPTFYNYDKSLIEKICKKQSKNIECLVRGKINYRFYPTPRINVKKVIVRDLKEKKTPIISIDNIVIKLSVKNLLAKEKHKFKKIVSNDYEVNLNLENFNFVENIKFGVFSIFIWFEVFGKSKQWLQAPIRMWIGGCSDQFETGDSLQHTSKRGSLLP